MKDLKVVIDTNVLVSILKGSPKLLPLYNAFKNKDFLIVITPQLLKELSIVLYRPRLKIDSKDIKELFRIIKERAVYIKPSMSIHNVCRDSKDEFILQAALETKADCVVTGDKDLLVIGSFKTIPIITPNEFIRRLQ